MSTDSDERKHRDLRDGNRNQSAKLHKPHHPSIDAGRRSSPRSVASVAAADDAASRRHGESATRPGKEGNVGKPEQRLAKQSPEHHIPSTASDGEDHHEHERPGDRQPPTTESASKKGPSPAGDPTQQLRRGSARPNSQTAAQLPAGAAVPHRFDGPRQEVQTSVAAVDTTTPRHGSKNTTKPDDARTATPPPPVSDSQPGANDTTSGKRASASGSSEISKKEQAQSAATATDDARPKARQEGNEDEDSQTYSDSEATSTNAAVAQDGTGITSGMLGGLATAFGIRPLTAKEARLEKENHKLKEENKILRSEYFSIQAAARKYHHDAFRFHHENQRLQETLEALSLEIKGVTKRYEEAKSLSDTRGKELIGAQVFLTKADGLSISELMQKVDGLNDEIYQAAASLGESIVQKQVEPSEQIQENNTAETLLGSPLCKVLRKSARKIEEGINPLLVQITLQTFFSVFCTLRIRSWFPSHLEFDAALRGIYKKIWTSSDQAVSGRWRSLTRAQLKPDTNLWIKELTTELNAILAVAMWEIGSPEDRQAVEARLPAIFKVVLDVREAIGEKFTSADIEVGYIEPHTAFNKAYMEETYAADSDGHGKEPEIVISTVGMGVRKIVSTKDGLAHEYVLAPKVVLESSLKAVLEPPPPRPSRSKSARLTRS